MRNRKNALNLIVITSLLSLLTACGGGGGSDSTPTTKTVTTLPNCTTNSIYHQPTTTRTSGWWTYSATDNRECKAITTISNNANCKYNEIRVRIPIKTNTNTQQTCVRDAYGYQTCGTPVLNNSSVFHSTVGQYQESCIAHNSPEWYYVVDAGSYYYYNYQYAYSHYQNYQNHYQYSYNKQLSTKETIVTFGVLAAALFFLAH